MVPYLPGMGLQPGRPSFVVPGLNGIQVRRQRGLRIHHDVLRAGQANQEIGPQPTVLGIGALLLVEIAMVEHPGHLYDPLQLDFAPAATDLGAAKGLDQIARLGRSCFWVSINDLTCSVRPVYAPARAFSSSLIFVSTLSSDSLTGLTSSRIACWRRRNCPWRLPGMFPAWPSPILRRTGYCL